MTRWRAAGAGLALTALLVGIDRYPLLDPDEGRNAEVAREMAASNDYILPQLNGLPYLDKPVLYFAVSAAIMELLGPSELTARLPSLFFTLGTLGILGWFARRWFGAEGAWVAVVATATSPLTLGFARTAIFDSALTFFVVVALFGFYEAVDRGGGDGWRWSTLAWGAIGLGILTKGPIALALPLLCALPYAWWRGASRAIWQPAGPLLCIALVLPWVLAVSRRVPDFLHYALVTETWVRLTTDQLQRTGPLWYFPPILLGGALPWTVAVLAGWRAARPLDRRAVFLLCWIAVPLLFFTLSQSKRPQYMVPLVPAVALLVARLWAGRRIIPGAAGIALTLGALATLLAAGHPLIPRLVPMTAEIRAALPGTAIGLGLAAAAAAVITWVARTHPSVVLVGLALPVSAIPFASDRLLQAIGRERSATAIAQAVSPVLDDRSQVLAVRAFPLSLPFYLGRTILLASEDGRELTSNYVTKRSEQWRTVPGSPLRPADWWRDALAGCRVRVFVVRAADRETRQLLDARLPLLIETAKYAAYGPCGGTDLARAR